MVGCVVSYTVILVLDGGIKGVSLRFCQAEKLGLSGNLTLSQASRRLSSREGRNWLSFNMCGSQSLQGVISES